MVQFYPWFNVYFPLFFDVVMYENGFETRETKNLTKDKIEPQQVYLTLQILYTQIVGISYPTDTVYTNCGYTLPYRYGIPKLWVYLTLQIQYTQIVGIPYPTDKVYPNCGYILPYKYGIPKLWVYPTLQIRYTQIVGIPYPTDTVYPALGISHPTDTVYPNCGYTLTYR